MVTARATLQNTKKPHAYEKRSLYLKHFISIGHVTHRRTRTETHTCKRTRTDKRTCTRTRIVKSYRDVE